jgi:hypothetical protein
MKSNRPTREVNDMAKEVHGTGANRSEVEIQESTPRVSEKHVGGKDWIAPDGRLPERKIDGADPDKSPK